MTPHERHDATVERLAAGLAEVLASRPRYAVLTRVRCQLLDGFPDTISTFDVAVIPADARWLTHPGGPVLSPDDNPRLAVNVVTVETLAEDMIAVPNTLTRTAVSEYVLFDPTGEALRPALQEFWTSDGELRRGWTTNHGVFFSGLDIRIDVRGADLVATPCGRGHVEEELFVLRWERERLDPADPKRAGYDARIAKLETRRLIRPGSWEEDEA
ncbi:MAG: hypothetical protein K2X87_15895 [Gemmataceae bacterium]|nr:hypothetical protein [Gemmataceae bacterium]